MLSINIINCTSTGRKPWKSFLISTNTLRAKNIWMYWFLFERFLTLSIRTFQIVFHCKSLVKKPCMYLLSYSFEDGRTIGLNWNHNRIRFTVDILPKVYNNVTSSSCMTIFLYNSTLTFCNPSIYPYKIHVLIYYIIIYIRKQLPSLATSFPIIIIFNFNPLFNFNYLFSFESLIVLKIVYGIT